MIDEEFYADDTLGGRLLAAREHAGMSLDRLAGELGIETQTLKHWETDRSEPSAERLVRMAALLGVRPLWLISGDIERPVPTRGRRGGRPAPVIEMTRSRAERQPHSGEKGGVLTRLRFTVTGPRTTH
ncbi:helix-turn-helix domain-containing protein [Martelella endophytica]|uniref:helix-turn-helix domain-containing protein n=1 Tax=Martelella endophytica TaxID=1486262 RepID=UPI000695A6C3|nr:helix-turn-helix transcriptional regulator [Martelella endophytica]